MAAFSCIFCSSTEGPSKEHVVSRETRREFHITGSVATLVGDSDDPEAIEDCLAVTLSRQICERCNNGWMNQLEGRVRPFFHEMMMNKARMSLDGDMQRDFARWATEKVFLIERTIRQRCPGSRSIDGYAGSDAELAWLANSDDPLPRSRVWLGAFDAEGNVAVSHRAGMGRSPAGTLAHLSTVTWGYTVFQVFSTDFDAAEAAGDENFPLAPPPPFGAAMQRVWPVADSNVQWPGAAFVARSDLNSLITWGGLLN